VHVRRGAGQSALNPELLMLLTSNPMNAYCSLALPFLLCLEGRSMSSPTKSVCCVTSKLVARRACSTVLKDVVQPGWEPG
jgi:hypothetical protein